jgi:dCMP deaminase
MDVTKSVKWKKRFMRMAFQVASWSKDTSSQVGSVIVTNNAEPRSYGFNGMPRGIDDDIPERHLRPEKYFWYEHAERNAIYQATTSLKGCTIFVTHLPCPDCSRGIIQSGIKHVVVATMNGNKSDFVKDRIHSLNASLPMLKESGIVYEEIVNDVHLEHINGELMVVPRVVVAGWEHESEVKHG